MTNDKSDKVHSLEDFLKKKKLHKRKEEDLSKSFKDKILVLRQKIKNIKSRIESL